MNQMTHKVHAFQPSGHDNVVSFGGTDANITGKPSLFSAIVAGLRRYIAARRTMKALERLDDAQLKDIGYRRIPGDYSRFEPMP